jgi:hypothetical protein
MVFDSSKVNSSMELYIEQKFQIGLFKNCELFKFQIKCLGIHYNYTNYY